MANCAALRIGLKYSLSPQLGFLCNAVQQSTNLDIVRYRHTKHWTPKWKQLRREKVAKVKLFDFHEPQEEITPERIRSKMKEQGLLPPRPWVERSFYVSCTGNIFEAYVPPEGDGKMSIVSVTGAKQKMELIEKKSKSMMAIRKIRSFEEEFAVPQFTHEAQDIYIRAHTYLAEKDKYKLREVVTERCYPEMLYNVLDKTIHWKFLKSLEPPRVVHARCTELITKDNVFSQITVRFHTQQLLAIYDRFGRLMHGSEIIAKDVLEYVVFEKHLANMYGSWRLHNKIIPDWMPPIEPSRRTYSKPEERVDVGISTSGLTKELEEKNPPAELPSESKPTVAAT